MASSEMIETAFGALEISRNAVLLTQGVEVVETTSDQLVGIGLMPDVPDDPVSIQIESLIQGQSELNDTKARAESTHSSACDSGTCSGRGGPCKRFASGSGGTIDCTGFVDRVEGQTSEQCPPQFIDCGGMGR